ncbi:MAG: FkbM family methyltransferase [Xanthobacteraceae bacterium]|nr:FkbM family methyltransferase [Xanthobacteraceae bacterium]
MDANLIFDIGAHRGEDTEFYLRKGFRVIGVEANPALYEGLRQKFKTFIADGRLKVVNKAISWAAGIVKFYVNKDVTEWGTFDPEWWNGIDERAPKVGRLKSRPSPPPIYSVNSACRNYVKIDIEGYDTIVLESFAEISERPEYVSIESDKGFVPGNSTRDSVADVPRI